MIEFRTGDILAQQDVEAIVNTVNCVGIMGRGIALQFKNAFPENFKAYQLACEHKEVQPGRMFVFETAKLNGPRYIINFPTKRHWRGKSRMEDIDSGLKALVTEIGARDIRSIAIPPLGSGLGGLNWEDVRPRIERALAGLENFVAFVYEPKGAPKARDMVSSHKVPNMTPGRAALVVLMDRYLSGLLDPFVTLLEVHKLMYFMQAAGQKLSLNYVKGPYGPYANELRHVLTKIEGYLVFGYADGGDAPTKQLELVPGAVQDADAVLKEDEAARHRFERVADLVQGFETPFGLELLSTLHWVVTQEGATSADEAVQLTYSWNDRKRQFSKHQIRLALDVLSTKGWIGPGFPVSTR